MTDHPGFEIRESKFYNFDVYDLRPIEKRWLACFRMFSDAMAYAKAQSEARPSLSIPSQNYNTEAG